MPHGLIVAVIGLETVSGPEEVRCALGVADPWVLDEVTVDVAIDLPADVGVCEAFDLRDVPLGEADAGRVFLFGEDAGVWEGGRAGLR